MDQNELDYRGYRFVLKPAGSGWRVLIFPPKGGTAVTRIPATANMFASAEVICEAKKIVDEILSSKR